jgi:hypothetical protein
MFETTMSDRDMWKMLHVLYTLKPGQSGLSASALVELGIDCGPDTFDPLRQGKAVTYKRGLFALAEGAQTILSRCVVANRRWPGDDIWVDYPSAFIVMPFSETWSDSVFRDLIKPSVEDAGLHCIRGDTVLRIGDLTRNVWSALLRAGVVIVDVSALNANVFYELGLAHAIGKDTFILKQAASKVPTDIGAAHYHEYDLQSLGLSKTWLTSELSQWATAGHSQAVKSLRAG